MFTEGTICINVRECGEEEPAGGDGMENLILNNEKD